MECWKCGKCCTHLDFGTAEEVSPDMERWYGLHDVLVERGGDLIRLLVPIPCQNLDYKTMKCKDYERRPQHCRKTDCRMMDAVNSSLT